jgi:phosphorylcholine metabolism protein LicD
MYLNKYLKYKKKYKLASGGTVKNPYGENIPDLPDKDIYRLLLKRWDQIATEHKIQYVIAYGTLLGQIRNQDFIPYDYDIDVIIDRDGVSKLYSLLSDESLAILNTQLKRHPLQHRESPKLILNAKHPTERSGKRYTCDGKLVPKKKDGCSFQALLGRLVYREQSGKSHYLDIFGYWGLKTSYGNSEDSSPFDFSVVPCKLSGIDTFRPDDHSSAKMMRKLYGDGYLVPDHVYNHHKKEWYQVESGYYGKNTPVLPNKPDYRKLLHTWNDISEQYNINYVIWFGSLLGWSRDKQIIPYDTDIDVIIDHNSISNLIRISTPTENYQHAPETEPGSNIKLVYNKDYNKPIPRRRRWDCNGHLVQKHKDCCSFNGPIARLIFNSRICLDIFAYYYYPSPTPILKSWLRKGLLQADPENLETYYPYGVMANSMNFDFKLVPCQLDGVDTYRPETTKMTDFLTTKYGEKYKTPDCIYYYPEHKWYKQVTQIQHTKLPLTPTNISKIRKDLTKLLSAWIDLADKHQIRWQITDGTLLGSFRDGENMPWDDDIDLRVHQDDWGKVEKIYDNGYPFTNRDETHYKKKLGKLINQDSSEVIVPQIPNPNNPRHQEYRLGLWYQLYLRTHIDTLMGQVKDIVHIDIVKASDKFFQYDPSGWGWSPFPWSRSRNYKLLGMTVPGPENPKIYLLDKYGKNYKKYPYCAVNLPHSEQQYWIQRWNTNPKKGNYNCQVT